MKSRIYWMDAFRGIAILIVIEYHVTYALRGVIGTESLFNVFNDAVGPIRMPALFFLSGMLVERSLKKGSRRYILGKLRHVAWPYLVWSTFHELIRDQDLSYSDFLRNLGPFEPGLWFLWYLFAFYMFHLLVQKIHPAILALTAMGVSMFISPAFDLPQLTYMYAFFALGVWFSRSLESFDRIVRSPVTIFALLVPVGYLIWASVTQGGVRFNPLLAPWVFGSILLLICICAHLEKWPWASRMLEFVGKHSIVFYVIHWPLILLLREFEPLTDIGRASIMVPLAFGIVVLTGVFVSILSDRFAWVRVFFSFPDTQLKTQGRSQSTRTVKHTERKKLNSLSR